MTSDIPHPSPAIGIEVHVDELPGCAAALADTAARVRIGPAGTGPAGTGPAGTGSLTVAAPGWASTEAALALAAAAQLRLASVADAVSVTGRQVAAVAADYRAADDRAAGRLRALW